MKKMKHAVAASVFALTGVFAGQAVAQDRELVTVEAPEYPRGAERRELEGHVTVRYSVTAEGTVANVEVVEANPEGVFDRAVLRALESWRYAPSDASTDGIERTFDFNLGG